MAFHEIISGGNATFGILVILLFILFVIAMKKVFSIIKNALIIIIAALLFPIVANTFLGLPVPTDANSLISFVLLGLSLYLIYLFGKAVYKILGLVEKSAKAVGSPLRARKKKKREKLEKKIEAIVKEKEEEEKLKKKGKKIVQEQKLSEYSEKDYVVLKDDASQKKFREKMEKEKPRKLRIEPLPQLLEDEENEEEE